MEIDACFYRLSGLESPSALARTHICYEYALPLCLSRAPLLERIYIYVCVCMCLGRFACVCYELARLCKQI